MTHLNNIKVRARFTLILMLIAFVSTSMSYVLLGGNSGIGAVLILGAVNVLFAFICGIIFSKSIKAPLKNISSFLKEIGQGHLNKKLDIKTKDEFGLLSELLNNFAYKLKNTYIGAIQNIAEGKFDVNTSVSDDEDEISPIINNITLTLKELNKEAELFSEAIAAGNTTYRANPNKFSGDYKKIIDNFNESVNYIVTVVRDGYGVMQKLTEGDLTARMEKEYPGNYNWYKDYINNLGSSLQKLVSETIFAISSTKKVSNEISTATERMASGAEEQANQTSEVASAVEEMTRTILETAQNTAVVSEYSKKARETAAKGKMKSDEAQNGINIIVQSSLSTGKVISSLAKKSEQIGEITQVINDIADQTNLLALNAAIEAARAGDHGRGFAVVADEVRKLSERTSKATKEIADTILSIQHDAKEADNLMSKSISSIEMGQELSGENSKDFNEITKGNEKISDLISQLAAASEEQSTAAEQISKNIEAISGVAQQSSADIHSIAATASDLIELTNKLEQIISVFNTGKERSGYDNFELTAVNFS